MDVRTACSVQRSNAMRADRDCFSGVEHAPVFDGPLGQEIFGDAMYQGYAQTELLPVAMMSRYSGSPRTCPARSRCMRELQISDENNRLPSASSMAE